MLKKLYPLLILSILGVILLSPSCKKKPDGLVERANLWDQLSGEWRLTPIYKINKDEFETSTPDQFTILKFRELNEDELKVPITETSLIVGDYLDVNNIGYGEQFLNLGTILGENHLLPVIFDFSIELKEDCFDCTYADIQHIDLLSCQTNSLPFSIEKLTETELIIQFIDNVYNRQIGNQTVLDTILYTFNKDDGGIITVSNFNINNYEKEQWYDFIALGGCGAINDAEVCSDGIDNTALCFPNPNSALCINESLKNAMGADNELTLSLWIKPLSIAWPKQIIYSRYENPAGPFILSLENSKLVLEINDGFGTFQRFSSVRTIEANNWTHISLSYKEQDLLLCINGQIDKREDVNTWLYDADGSILLGNSQYALDNNLAQGFVGKIDEVIFFKRYLSQEIIFQLYQWHLNN